jgi:prophage maintenance system killer protein
MKIYTLTIAYNDETEEVEYLHEEVMTDQEGIEKIMDYTTLEIDLDEWETTLTDTSIEILRDIAEA